MSPSTSPRFTITTPYPHPAYNSRAASFLQVKAFQRGDFDRFADNVKSGKAWRDAWRSANDGFEQFVFEAKKTAERIDRQYAVSRRFSSAASSAGDRAREIDREFGISPRVRSFSADLSRNFPKVYSLMKWVFVWTWSDIVRIGKEDELNFMYWLQFFERTFDLDSWVLIVADVIYQMEQNWN